MTKPPKAIILVLMKRNSGHMNDLGIGFFYGFETNDFSGGTSKPRTVNHATRRHLLLQSQKIVNLDHLLDSRLPRENESIHIRTEKSFDAFTFVLLILKTEKIAELWAAVYRIGEKTTKALLQLISDGRIEKTTIVINDGFSAFAPDVNRLLVLNLDRINITRCNNHAKVTLVKTESGKYYVIEGSGNWSVNARIEQYVFLQSKEIFDFHRQWMSEYGGGQ